MDVPMMRPRSTFASVRPAAIAGEFYAAAPRQLEREVRSHLAVAPGIPHAPPSAKALIVPHAGLIYSGVVAASAFRGLEARRGSIDRIVMIGPVHRVWIEGLAVPSVGAFATPLGEVPVDDEGRRTLLEIPGVAVDDRAHADEHCLEVELPFLQLILDTFRILPILVGDAAPELVARALEAVWNGPTTLIVASSDLSHYHSYEVARAIDAATARAILGRSTQLAPEEACGAYAINGLMVAARAHGLAVTELARLTSGDTAGDRRRVVGYGSFALHGAQPA
jgi:MEMO1 family protein